MKKRSYAYINLNALEHNIKSIRARLGDDTKLLAVVKADAYGNGAVRVSRFLEKYSDFFGVACVEEAIELINSGIKKSCLVLGYVSEENFEEVIENEIRIPVFSFDNAKALSDKAQEMGKKAYIHFCVDTGMSRIGFQVKEAEADICLEISRLRGIECEGLFSHFATADTPDLSRTVEQKSRFDLFADMLEKRGVNIAIKHINNSAGIMNFGGGCDMVRAGIILYGLYPSEEVDKSLLDIRPVMEWKTYISHIKTLESGREISYGGTYKTDKDTVVATVPVGYADGYPRCLSNKGRVIVNGRYANILGRVCMDQMMIDISDIPDVKVLDEVVLIGSQGDAKLTVEELSQESYSFNYELPCRLTRRVARAYTYNDEVVGVEEYL